MYSVGELCNEMFALHGLAASCSIAFSDEV